MAASGDYTITNRTVSLTKSLPLYDMDEMENYAPTVSSGKGDYLNTIASSPDGRERVVLYWSPVRTVPSSVPVNEPSKRRLESREDGSKTLEGIRYGAYIDIIHRTTLDTGEVVDRPCRYELTCTHEDVGTITLTQVKEGISRLISVLTGEDGEFTRLANIRGGVTSISTD